MAGRAKLGGSQGAGRRVPRTSGTLREKHTGPPLSLPPPCPVCVLCPAQPKAPQWWASPTPIRASPDRGTDWLGTPPEPTLGGWGGACRLRNGRCTFEERNWKGTQHLPSQRSWLEKEGTVASQGVSPAQVSLAPGARASRRVISKGAPSRTDPLWGSYRYTVGIQGPPSPHPPAYNLTHSTTDGMVIHFSGGRGSTVSP